jgi:hypothetical protein
MDIRAEVSPTKPPLTPSKALVAVMPSYMEDALRAMLNEIEAAYQPEKLKGTYSIDAIESDSGVMLELTVEDGALFESFVKGSVPHFPPWQDAEHPDGLPFGVALYISEHGTPPHPEIDDIIERGEERIAQMGIAGVDAWLEGIV